jgi:hypothetical protein
MKGANAIDFSLERKDNVWRFNAENLQQKIGQAKLNGLKLKAAIV